MLERIRKIFFPATIIICLISLPKVTQASNYQAQRIEDDALHDDPWLKAWKQADSVHPTTPNLLNWMPKNREFQLYINTNNKNDSTSCLSIDILYNNTSWPFYMWQEPGLDTVFLAIAPPGYKLAKRQKIDSLREAFPIVILGGIKNRAAYWIWYYQDSIIVDTLLSDSFITLTKINLLPKNIVYVQLEGLRNLKKIRKLITSLKNLADLQQVDSGFYYGIWYLVQKDTISRWKINKTQKGPLLFFKLKNLNQRDKVISIIKEITKK